MIRASHLDGRSHLWMRAPALKSEGSGPSPNEVSCVAFISAESKERSLLIPMEGILNCVVSEQQPTNRGGVPR